MPKDVQEEGGVQEPAAKLLVDMAERAATDVPPVTVTSTAPRRRPVGTLSEWLLVLAAAALPLLWRWITGSIRLPAGDAWAYQRIVQVFHDTGVLRGVGWNDITLLGVLIPVMPWLKVFGSGPIQLATLTSVFGAVSLAAVRSLLSAADRRRSGTRLIALASVAFFAGFVGTSGTFLVDLYAFAGIAWAVALAVKLARASTRFANDDERQQGWRGAERWAPQWLVEVGVVVAALFAFSVRQQSGVVPLALCLYLIRTGYPGRRLFKMVAAFIVPAVIFFEWRSRLDGGGRIFYQLSARGALAGWFSMTLFLGAGLAPMVVASGRARACFADRRLRTLTIGLSSAMFLATLVPDTNRTVGHISLITTIDSWNAFVRVPVFATICAAAALGVVVTVDLVRQQLWSSGVARSPWRAIHQPSVATLLAWVGTCAVFADVAVVGLTAWYDPRYSLTSMACFAGLLLARSTSDDGASAADPSATGDQAFVDVVRPVRRPLARGELTVGAVLVGLLALAALANLDHASITVRAQFAAAKQIVCLGIPADHIDGGFVWNGVAVGQADPHGPNAHPNDGFPENIDIQWYPALQRQAYVSLKPVSATDTLEARPPVVVHGLMPGSRVVTYGLVRTSAITNRNGC